MKIVIDIEDELYQMCKDLLGDAAPIERAIADGTPLPKGHGRLIDAKELRQDIIAHKYSINFCEEHNIDQSINVGMLNILLADAPTIIETDTETDGVKMSENPTGSEGEGEA